MEKRLRILLYGDTLVLAGIQASLGSDPSLEVIRPARLTSEQELYDLRPDVVIFDVATVQPELRYVLMQELHGLLLVGVDPETHQALVLSGQPVRALTTDDLLHVIESHVPAGETRGRGDAENEANSEPFEM